MAQNWIDIVLNGHDHSYQRWKPLDGTGAVSSGGITEFVAGGGGHGLQEFIRSDPRLAAGFYTPDSFGALRLQLNEAGAGFQYVNTAGVIVDSGSVACSGAQCFSTRRTRLSGLKSVMMRLNATRDAVIARGLITHV